MFVAVVLAATIAVGCGDSSDKSSGSTNKDTVRVVAAFYPLAWVAEQMEGANIEVINLTPPGVEPHDLELAPRDLATIKKADVVLYIGDGFQPALEDALKGSEAKKIDVLEIEDLDVLAASEDDGHGHGEGSEDHANEDEDDGKSEDHSAASDPHVWLDPSRLATISTHIAEELDLDAGDLNTSLTKLDSDFKAGLASCQRRELFTSHAAFSYLADRYDLEQIAISGLSPDAEPLPQDLKRVADKAREHQATTIFFETLVSPKLSKQVAKEVGAKTAVLDPIEGIEQDRLDEGVDYPTVMQRNLKALRAGLDCK